MIEPKDLARRLANASTWGSPMERVAVAAVKQKIVSKQQKNTINIIEKEKVI